MRNLLLDDLDRRAELISGSLKPLSMVQGVTSEAKCALFIGYHAGAGSQAGILDHTYYGRVVARLRVGGKDWNETALNAAVCGAVGVPVALVTGDQTVCAQAKEHLGTVATVVVKDAITRYCARTMLPQLACEKIQLAATAAVKRPPPPFRPPPPYELELDFVNAACADAAELVPGTRRVGGLTCAYTSPDAPTLIQVIQAWTTLASTTMV
jgi:D-amino peptidase